MTRTCTRLCHSYVGTRTERATSSLLPASLVIGRIQRWHCLEFITRVLFSYFSQSSDCSNSSCCFDGTAQQREEWCSSNQPYEVIDVFGGKSQEVFLPLYFRFFLPPKLYCRPFLVRPVTSYGSVDSYLSMVDAVPSADASQWFKRTSDYTFGMTSFVVCPVIHPLTLWEHTH